MRTRNFIFFICSFLITMPGCSVLSGDSEVILPATEVGTPIGEKVRKQIGPSGGTLSSADGKLTLTVPPNAVSESVTFEIGAITNKAANAIGHGYRLEPDGITFRVPVEVSMRFDDKDVDGTMPEALFAAYQDKQGAWHANTAAKLDLNAKTITIATTHFTDFATFANLRLIPPSATVRVGKAQIIQLLSCAEQGIIDRLLSRPLNCEQPPYGEIAWTLEGPGKIQTSAFSREQGMVFTTYLAPSTKPNPNKAVVKLRTKFRPWNTVTGENRVIEKDFESRITIIGGAYKATGSWGGITFSGTVCSLEVPFTIKGQSNFLTFNFLMTPSGSGKEGTVSIGGGGGGVTINSGRGSYTVTGTETDSPRITMTADAFTGSYPGAGSAQGSGTRIVQLVPLETDECGGAQ